MGTLSAIATTLPLKAAENIEVIYGPLQLPVSVASLEAFAKTGTLNDDLALLGSLEAKQRDQFREVLVERYAVRADHLDRFFQTAIGQDILAFLDQSFTS